MRGSGYEGGSPRVGPDPAPGQVERIQRLVALQSLRQEEGARVADAVFAQGQPAQGSVRAQGLAEEESRVLLRSSDGGAVSPRAGRTRGKCVQTDCGARQPWVPGLHGLHRRRVHDAVGNRDHGVHAHVSVGEAQFAEGGEALRRGKRRLQ